MDAITNKWLIKQYRGLAAYREEVDNRNFIFDSIAIEFGRFSNLDGLILDVGCGIRSDLAYAIYSKESNFVGIDPLNGKDKRGFVFINAVGENLPFKENSFDHVLFATSLDHVANPSIVLKEARRVLKIGGKMDLWCACFDWFERLQQGERIKAITLFFWNLDFKIRKKDDFHFSHFTTRKILSLLNREGVTILRYEKVLSDTSTAMSVFFQAEKAKE